ncbi:uncharacterized protein EI90DRAFT_3106941 [Cantharellus anzutake]|uniref:uncharacterized protein n=1 Tax=Cantharellus anzutake TaxID=1750568 RepID=UPI001907EB1A|nr:uncharacterized protein EI90DRAFT_3106941 [Cantharellus anzutake]KAF8308997.1 hypothetical protein EI90DRAFT_3106941 [Cantharellus anzutake]
MSLMMSGMRERLMAMSVTGNRNNMRNGDEGNQEEKPCRERASNKKSESEPGRRSRIQDNGSSTEEEEQNVRHGNYPYVPHDPEENY